MKIVFTFYMIAAPFDIFKVIRLKLSFKKESKSFSIPYNNKKYILRMWYMCFKLQTFFFSLSQTILHVTTPEINKQKRLSKIQRKGPKNQLPTVGHKDLLNKQRPRNA